MDAPPPKLYVSLPGSTSWTQAEEQGTGQTATSFKKTITATSGYISGELQSDGLVKYPLYTYLYETYRNGTLVSSTSSPLYIYLAFNDDGTPTAVYDNDGIAGSDISLSRKIVHSVLLWTITDTQNPNKQMQTGSVLKGQRTVTTSFNIVLPQRITVIAPAGAAITCTWKEELSATVPAGTQQDFFFYNTGGSGTPSSYITFTAQLIAGHTILQWRYNEYPYISDNPSVTLRVYAGDIISCITQIAYEVTIIAPPDHAIAYTAGVDGTEQTSGTVSAGATEILSLTRPADSSNLTFVLEVSDFTLDSFGGWTKNGIIVDRYSNPATFIANESATYSCIIGQGTTPSASSGRLLYGNRGTLIYASPLKSATSHTIDISAEFEDEGHNITCSITKPSETQEADTTGIATSFSRTKTITYYPATGSASGKLLFADKPIKRLIKILFHCDNAVHKYTLTLKVDGAEIFHNTLSGTFSKTLEVT